MDARGQTDTVFDLNDVAFSGNGKPILRSVSLAVHRGEHVVLSGPSGSGKSTLLLLMAGAIPPSSGSVVFRGHPVQPESLATVRRQVAYVTQEPPLETGTVRDALVFPFAFRANRDQAPTDETMGRLLRDLGLPADVLAQDAAQLSGGEKQRVAVARAILLKRDVFLLDEVTSALDEDASARLATLLCAEGHTVVAVSHDTEWRRRCSRHLVVSGGELSVAGRPREHGDGEDAT